MISTVGAGLLGPLPQRRSGRYGFRAVLALLAVLAVVAVGIGEAIIGSRSEAILAAARHRATVILQNRAETVGDWLPRWEDATAPLRTNPTIQVFAATASGGGIDPDMVVYLQSVLDDFASRRPDIAAAYMLDSTGQSFLAASHGLPLDEPRRHLAREVFGDGASRIGGLRPTDAGLVYDVAMPILPAQAVSPDAAARPVAVLLLGVRAQTAMTEALAPGRTLEADERVFLLQSLDNSTVAVDAGGSELRQIPAEIVRAAADFGVVSADGEHYVLDGAVPGTAWRILYQRDAAFVHGQVMTTRLVVYALILAALACVGAGVLIVWWRQSLHNSQQLAAQYREFAARIEAQHQLLNSINDTITEEITVIDASRKIVYANTAFADRVDREPSGCVGEAINRLLTPELARRLAERDAQILAGEILPIETIEDTESATPRWLAVSKVPFLDANGAVAGVVTLMRDVTEAQSARERQRQTMENTIRVLSRSVAAADPFLANHAERLRDFAVAIARELGCSETEVETIGTAASLSQIGKIFLPRALIRNDTRLTAEERAELSRHIDYALDALKGIAFELPVPEALEQLHERLDGSGYPRGRSGAEISRAGRILAVADVFAARTEARAYRGGSEADPILEILWQHPEKYDAEVVAALMRVVSDKPYSEV